MHSTTTILIYRLQYIAEHTTQENTFIKKFFYANTIKTGHFDILSQKCSSVHFVTWLCLQYLCSSSVSCLPAFVMAMTEQWTG